MSTHRTVVWTMLLAASTTACSDVFTAPPRTASGPGATFTASVERVIDGDTIKLTDGRTVRVVGIDTPERGECGFGPASSAMKNLVEGQQVSLVQPDENADRYGRLLRYVDVGPTDAGLKLIRDGLAIARYDSRDGYGAHEREQQYIKADQASVDYTCRPRPPAPPPPGTVYKNCAAARAAGAAPIRRGQPGYGRHLDRDGDGVGCDA